jgi:predicted transcriptional regulator
MKTITIHVRINEELDRDLGMVAVAIGRSKSWLIAEALKSYSGWRRNSSRRSKRGSRLPTKVASWITRLSSPNQSGATAPDESALD